MAFPAFAATNRHALVPFRIRSSRRYRMAAEPVRLALRKLWSDHVIWTREYIIAATSGPHGVTDMAEHLPVGEAGHTVAATTQAALGAMPMSDADAAAARLLK